MLIQYDTGTEVKLGDVLITGNGKRGVVKLIIYPGTTDAQDWSCPEGGILIEEDWDGTPSLLVIPNRPKGDWEDMKFVRRGAVPSP